MKLTEKILQDLSDIKSLQSVHNEILDRHERRSTQLEARFQPIEDHVKFERGLFKLITALAALGAGLSTAYHYLVR